jgi:hypothetical protein
MKLKTREYAYVIFDTVYGWLIIGVFMVVFLFVYMAILTIYHDDNWRRQMRKVSRYV